MKNWWIKLTWNGQSIDGWVAHSDDSNPISSNLKINLRQRHLWEKQVPSSFLFESNYVVSHETERTQNGFKKDKAKDYDGKWQSI